MKLLRNLLIILAVWVSVAACTNPVLASFPHGIGTAIPPGINCNNFAIQNGCATRASGIDTGQPPGFQDSNMILDSAESGQIPATGDPNYATRLASRTSYYRKFSSAIPGADFPIGSQDPSDSGSGGSSLSPIGDGVTSGVDVSVEQNGVCKYYIDGAPGAPNTGTALFGFSTNFIYCLVSANNQTVTIKDRDFTNEGGGNNTSFVPIYLKANGGCCNTGTKLVLTNDYNGCFSSTCRTAGITYDASHPNGHLTGGGGSHWITTQSSSGNIFLELDFINCTYDGDVFNIVAAYSVPLTSSFAPLENLVSQAFQDLTHTQKIVITNCVVERLGHDAVLTVSSTDLEITTSIFKQTCVSGFNACHGEIGEIAQGTGFRADLTQNITSSVWWQGDYGSTDSTQVVTAELTAPVYMSSGGQNGAIVHNSSVKDFFIFQNNGHCANNPIAGNAPYSNNNACSPAGSGGGLAMISHGHGGYYDGNLDYERILSDLPHNIPNCYNIGIEIMPFGSANFNTNGTTATLSQGPGVNPMTTTGTSSGLNFKGYTWFYPGQGLIDYGGNVGGFVTTHALPTGGGQTGTANPTATMSVTGIGTGGSNPGAGMMALSTTHNFEVGQRVIFDSNLQDVGFISSGCPSSCLAAGTALNGVSTVQLVTTSPNGTTPIATNSGATTVRNYNSTTNAVAGDNVYVGTITLADSEPNSALGINREFGTYAYVAGTVTSTNNFVNSTGYDATGTAVNFTGLTSPSMSYNSGSCN